VNVSEDQIKTVVNTVYESVQDWAKNDVLPNMDKIVVNIGSGVIGGLKFVYNFLIGIIASIYIMANKEYLAARGKKVIYAVFKLENANLVLDGLGAVNRVFGQFINGKILDSVIIGLIAFIVLTIIQMPYALLISVIIGVTNIIPFFGPIIGAIPTVTIVLIADPFMSLVLLIFILILQQFDGNILGPKILGDSIGLSSFWILTAVIIGGGVFGFLGMLLAVPVFACCYMYINRSCTIKLKKNNMAYKTSEYERIVRIDNETGAPIYRSEEEEDIRFKKKTPEEKQRIKEEKKAARRIHVERHIKNESSENEAAATKDENDDK
jgi:predicted PurR-regulated permease PerM